MSSSAGLVIYVPQLAELLGCRTRWIEDRLRSGVFPGHKICRKWALTEDDVREILRRLARPAEYERPVDAVATVVPRVSSATRTTARRMDRIGPAP